MKTLRLRIFALLLALSVAPLTLLLIGVYLLPTGFLGLLWYGLLASLAATLAVGVSGYMLRPTLDLARAFDQMLRSGGHQVPQSTWLPAEFTRLQRTFSQFVQEKIRALESAESDALRARHSLKEAERHMHHTYATLQSLFDASCDGILVSDPSGHILSSNQALDTHLGRPVETIADRNTLLLLADIAGRFTSSTEVEKLINSATDDPSHIGEAIGQTAEEQPRYFSLHTQPIRSENREIIGRLWLLRDASESRRLSEKLQQAQKMESIGQLAGGIAHDFNNLLTAIQGNLSLAEMESEGQTANTREKIQGASRATQRAAELVKQLLGYSRKKVISTRPVDLNNALSDVQNILRHSIDPRVTIRTQPGTKLWLAQADEVHIEQVILNICLNARDALPENGGLIEISSSNHRRDERRTPLPDDDVIASDFVLIRIKDNGSGIPEDKRDHIFEPFYSTKDAGKGTGLGLAMAQEIIHEHGGWIDFDSKVGEGTEFCLYIPRAETTPAPVKVVAEEPITSSKDQATKEASRLLIVDDEESVRSIAVTMLRYLGYQVSEAANGEEALAVVSEAEVPFDAILLDIYMPKLSGRDTFKRLRATGCHTPIIVCSGFVIDPDEFVALSEDGAGPIDIIQKPYAMRTLAASIAKAIASGSPVLSA